MENKNNYENELDNIEEKMEQCNSEIKNYQKYIDNPKKIKKRNKKNKIIKSFLLPVKIVQFTIPFVLLGGLTYKGFSSLDGTPFIRDDVKKQYVMEVNIDSEGNKNETPYFEKDNNKMETIIYSSKWEKNDDKYVRTHKVYAADKIKDEIIEKIVRNNEIPSLEELFDDPISVNTEIKTKLTEEDKNIKDSLSAVYYKSSDDYYIKVKEEIVMNIFSTFIWLIFTLFGEEGLLVFLSEIGYFDIWDGIDNNLRDINEDDLRRKYKFLLEDLKEYDDKKEHLLKLIKE